MRENFWHFHRHLAGMRALPRLTVHAQLHREFMWIGNFISSYNPGPQWAECIDSLDRKSTRLNSSHLVISYAVFCLKKKKKIKNQYKIHLYNNIATQCEV